MKILVVLGHQRRGSFCHAIVDTAVAQLKAAGHETIVHDLYAEGFDPILPHEEIGRDVKLEPAIQQHCDEVMGADGYLVVHPNWWGQPPAILKGWVDRVLRQGLVYEFGEGGQVIGRLAGRTAVVITTSNTPREAELAVFGDPLENLWKTCVFGFCGIEDFTRRNFESIILSTPGERAAWLEETKRIMAERFPA